MIIKTFLLFLSILYFSLSSKQLCLPKAVTALLIETAHHSVVMGIELHKLHRRVISTGKGAPPLNTIGTSISTSTSLPMTRIAVLGKVRPRPDHISGELRLNGGKTPRLHHGVTKD